MAKGIGIRVTPRKIFYTVMEENRNSAGGFVNENLVIPKALDTPRQLSYIRTTLFSLICEYQITEAGLRTAEGIAKNKDLNLFRLNIEGVIQELFANSTINNYFAGTLNSMDKHLNTTNKKLKQCYKEGHLIH